MPSIAYRLSPEHLRPKRAKSDAAGPASGLLHDGKLNMGPALLLAGLLSLGGWAALIELALRLFR